MGAVLTLHPGGQSEPRPRSKRSDRDPIVVLSLSESALADIIAATAELLNSRSAERWDNEVLRPLLDAVAGGVSPSLMERVRDATYRRLLRASAKGGA